jgi:hypothetical protein
MGILFRSAAASGGSTPQALSVPVGVVNGDLLFMCAALGGGSSNGTGFNALSGWVQLEQVVSAVGFTADMTTWWKVANSEPASYTPVPRVGSGSSVLLAGAVLAYRNVVPASPIRSISSSVLNSAAGPGSATSPAPGSLVGVTVGDVSIICYGWMDDLGGSNLPPFTTPSGWTSRVDVSAPTSGFSPGLKVVEKAAGTDIPTISSGSNPGVWSTASTALTGSLPSTGMLTFFN